MFTIDPASLSAQGEQARAQVAGARTQIAAAEANVEQAEAEVAAAAAQADKARQDLARLLRVHRDDPAAVAGQDIDAARAALRDATARLAGGRRNGRRRVAPRSPPRAPRQKKREAASARCKSGSTSWRRSRRRAARVEEVFYQVGEWVAANQPIVSLLPDNRVKVRFFVPEQKVAAYRPGTPRPLRLRRLRQRPHRAHHLRQPAARIHPADHLQPETARPAGVHGRSASGAAPRACMPGLPVDVTRWAGEP